MLRVYAKHKENKRAYAVDMSNGVLVSNLIYATIYNDEDKEKLQKEVDYMNTNNPDYKFEIRSCK